MQHYLRLMGIDVWRLRATRTSSEYYRYNLLNSDHRQVGLLLADVVLANQAEQMLVEKIAQATKKQITGGLTTDNLAADKFAHCVVVLLGATVTQLFSHLFSDPIISYSPAELLGKPKLKAKTWDDLKKAIRLMQ